MIGPYVPNGVSGAGHLVLAIDIKATRPREAFETDMERLIDELKATPLQPGADQIYYPGEIEAMSDARLGRYGIRLPKDTADELRDKAGELGIVAPVLRSGNQVRESR